jgi:hypothetical protein
VTNDRRDLRDERTDVVYALINAAIEDNAQAGDVSGLLLPEGAAPYLPDWPRPDADAQHLARLAVRAAVPCVLQGAEAVRIGHLYSPSRHHPEAQLKLDAEPPAAVVFRAPLVVECLEQIVTHSLAQLLVYAYGPKVRPLFADDVHLGHMRRLNNYLYLEANLWWLASQGGCREPVPYAVRYETARWLWSPRIAGFAFCLRCGQDVAFHRTARDGTRRNLRCSGCSRGPVDRWPAHAVAPHIRGRWWLRCLADGCRSLFIGAGQARRCSTCRSSATTPNRRRPLRS